MEKMDGLSMNIEKEARERLQSVFPECFSEGQLDIDKLLTMCGEYITNDFEKYKFEWNGKGEAMKLAQRRSAACLRPCIEESVNFDTTQNLYIEGDNLEVLKLLQTAYFRQVKMIYIDPPYNTGHDFVYEDDFKDPLERYLEVTSQATKSNPETMGRFHTAWLNMMYPRLRLAANLLRDDGVIFISIDDNEVHNLRKLCDEVFGEENFIAQISLLCNPKGRSQDKYVANCHEFILCYSKSVLTKGSVSIKKTEDDIKNDYPLEDEGGFYRELELRNTHRDFGKHNRPNLYYPFYVYGDGKVSITPISQGVSIYPKWDDGFAGCWTWGKDKAIENIALLIAKKVNNSWKIYRKAYATQDGEAVKKQLKSIWIDKQFHTEKGQAIFNSLFETKEKIFQSPKSIEFILELAKMSQATDNDIILDFFSGSATTAHAVMQLNKEDGGNRRFICVQIPELCDEKSEAYKAGYKNICEIGKERIRRAGAKLLESDGQMALGDDRPPLDVGFKVFKLDSSNIKFWDGIPVRPGNGQMYFDKVRNVIDGIKDDRPPLDVVFELMLKLGVPLTVPVEIKEIQGKSVYSVDGDLLLFCLDKNITAEFIEALADLAPAKIIVAEMGFADDTAMANAHYILKDRGIEIKLV